MVVHMDVGETLRAIRWARRLSQRELAEVAGLPATTVDRIESGHTKNPRLGTVESILAATGYRLVVMTEFGRVLRADDQREQLRDSALRRVPAHLEVEPVIGEGQDGWWGWRRIAWLPSDPRVPEFSYARRRKAWQDPYYANERWNDAT